MNADEHHRTASGPISDARGIDVLEPVAADRAVCVVRSSRVADPDGLVDALLAAGLRTIEFTFSIPDVVDLVRHTVGRNGATIGAGTIYTAEQAEAAVEAGARFLASPIAPPGAIDVAQRTSTPCILGAHTPTEVRAAHEAGAAIVKLFPARVGGPAYLRDLLAVMPDVRLMPSGGVDESSAGAYLDAGAFAVFGGTSVLPPDAVAVGDTEEIARRANRFARSLRRPASTDVD